MKLNIRKAIKILKENSYASVSSFGTMSPDVIVKDNFMMSNRAPDYPKTTINHHAKSMYDPELNKKISMRRLKKIKLPINYIKTGNYYVP